MAINLGDIVSLVLKLGVGMKKQGTHSKWAYHVETSGSRMSYHLDALV